MRKIIFIKSSGPQRQEPGVLGSVLLGADRLLFALTFFAHADKS